MARPVVSEWATVASVGNADRVTTPQDLDDRFRETLGALPEPERRCDPAQPVRPGAALTGRQLLALFDAQVTSRQLDLAGRWLRSFDEGFYTIGSAGHEANAAVAAALRPTDPALLHYRSGAFYCLRAAQAAGVFPGGGTPAASVPDRDADADPATTAPHPDGEAAAGHPSEGAAAAGQPSDGAAAAGDGDDAVGPPPGADPEPAVTDDPRATPAGVPDAPDGVALPPPPAGPVTYRVGADGTAEPVPRHQPTPIAPGPVPAVTDPAPASADPAFTDPASTGPGHTGPGDVTPAGAADRGAVAGTPSAPADRPVPAPATGPAERPPGDRDAWEQAYAEAARDVLSGMVASARDPIAGGRHKVFGRADLAVVPTTSTIASHLPRAVGLGLAVERLRRIDTAGRRDDPAGPPRSPWPRDAIVVCSFGDASVNHASATAAFNTAGWYDHTGLRIPVLFVCEDNGLGISVRSPDGWVERTLRARPGCATSPPTAPTRWPRTRWPPRPPAGCGGTVVRRCCTCGRYGCWGTPARTPSGRTAAPPRSPPTRRATRCWPPPGCSSRRGWPPVRSCWPATTSGAGRYAVPPRRCSTSRSWPARPRWWPRCRPAGRCG